MAPRPSPQTDRVIDLFGTLAADPGQGLSLAEISRRLGVHKASCHAMLTSLLHAGWVLRDPTNKAYTLGPALLRLGEAAASRYPALDLARPAMSRLARATDGHVIAFLVDGDHVTVAHQVRNMRVPGTPMAIGTELPTQPPYGAALTAWAATAEQERWLSKLPEDIRERYREALSAARRRGYTIGLHVLPDLRQQELASLIRAVETGDNGGRLSDLAGALTDELLHREEWFLASVSPGRTYDVSHLDAPVIGAGGQVELLLSLVPVPSSRTGASAMALGTELASTAAGLSAALGGPVPGDGAPEPDHTGGRTVPLRPGTQNRAAS